MHLSPHTEQLGSSQEEQFAHLSKQKQGDGAGLGGPRVEKWTRPL